MELYGGELDCEHVEDVLVVSRKHGAGAQVFEQRVFMNEDGVFRFDEEKGGKAVPRVLRLPFVKVWVFCSMVCDMLAMKDDVEGMDETWEVMARDRYGNRYRAEGCAVFNDVKPFYDPSVYLRRETGISSMWLLDGNA